MLEAHAEPLLGGTAGERWDIIFSNIPAKAGSSVLEDYIRRCTGLLNPGGRVILVVVHTLTDFFREQSSAAGIEPLEIQGGSHSVFVFGPVVQGAAGQSEAAVPVNCGPGFFLRYPFYKRTVSDCSIEKTSIRIESIHGASGYDAPGGAVLAAAKLARRIGLEKITANSAPWLIHEGGQGFFLLWLLKNFGSDTARTMVISGRNILALESSRHNAELSAAQVSVVPVVDLQLGQTALLEAAGGGQFSFIAAFPELLPQSALAKGTDQLVSLWESLPPLLADGGIFLAACSSSEAERFDRKKPTGVGFTRLGSLKKNSFCATAYQLSITN